jgi:betaine-aldehyde dehydrogenase
MDELKLYIHGRLVDATSNETLDNVNPATGEVIGKIQAASKADVDNAVESAREGFAEWSRMTGAQRGRVLMKAVNLLRARNDELARIEVQDTGKPIAEAILVDVSSGADAIEYFAGVAPTLHGDHYDFGTAFAYTRREPLGVCAGIGAWNYPIQIACWKSAPALACGNAMVFKPAHLTPNTAVKLAEIYTEAGLPNGVFNVVNGAGSVGAALCSHPGIAKVSLTGSVATGKRVMAAAAETLKKVTLELGGKSPLIIFADADLDNAVSAAIMGNFYTQGEICSNCTRVFVEEPLLAPFLAKLKARVGNLTIGDPLDPGTHVGALISTQHMNQVLTYIETGKREGAKLILGGQRVTTGKLGKGCFVQPTIFAGCRDDMTIVKEEIFGPVMSILTFRNEDEVIERANDTEFGLSAGVFTKDIQRAHRVIAQLQAGTCWINNYNITPIEMPFGGNKQSGIGRENSLAAVEHYTQLKSVYVEGGDVAAPY